MHGPSVFDEARFLLVRSDQGADHSDVPGVAPRYAFAARAVREVGKLFAGSDTWLAVIAPDASIVSTSREGQHAGLEDLFSADTVRQLRVVLSVADADSTDAVQVVRGQTTEDQDIELRVFRAAPCGDYFLALVRPHAEAAGDRARSRVRQLTAALQAVADIVVPLEELQGHEEARHRASVLASLTDRERRVALAVAGGVRTSQIASDLFVSQSTVRNYLPTIYRKLGVASRSELVELLNSSD